MFDLKKLLDRELFENLITKHKLSCKLVTLMTTAAAGEVPEMVWLLLESDDFAADVQALLAAGTYLDHYRHEFPVAGRSLFGCDGVPTISQQGAARARLCRTVPGLNVELVIEVFSPKGAKASLEAVRSFYDGLKATGIEPTDIAVRFARPGSKVGSSSASTQ